MNDIFILLKHVLQLLKFPHCLTKIVSYRRHVYLGTRQFCLKTTQAVYKKDKLETETRRTGTVYKKRQIGQSTKFTPDGGWKSSLDHLGLWARKSPNLYNYKLKASILGVYKAKDTTIKKTPGDYW